MTRAPALSFRVHASALIALGALAAPACTCGKHTPPDESSASAGSASAPSARQEATPSAAPAASARFSAPIAAARVAGSSDVVVVGLDVASKAIRLQRIDASDAVKLDRTVLEDVAWSPDADLKLFSSAAGTALVWRGKRGGKTGRALVVLGPDLAPRAGTAPRDVGATSCATQDAFVHADAKKIGVEPLGAGDAGTLASSTDTPKDREVALACGTHRAFAVLEHDDGADVAELGSRAGALATRPLLRDAELEGDTRERSEYVVGDELGVVRLSAGGALVRRETKDGKPGKLEKVKTTIPQDDDVVGVDASARQLVVVYTHETEGGCPSTASPATKVMALRIDRTSGAESVVELSSGTCGRELGPFYTAPFGDAVNVSWVERVPTAGKARPSIAALAHVAVVPEGAAKRELAHLDVDADALADAGCDATQCAAAALVRSPGMDAMVPGPIKVLRYTP